MPAIPSLQRERLSPSLASLHHVESAAYSRWSSGSFRDPQCGSAFVMPPPPRLCAHTVGGRLERARGPYAAQRVDEGFRLAFARAFHACRLRVSERIASDLRPAPASAENDGPITLPGLRGAARRRSRPSPGRA